MATWLTFPDDDPEELRRCCDDLARIIMNDVAAYTSWLRGCRDTARRISCVPISWPAERSEAIAHLGVIGALHEGAVTTAHLRRLATDPDLLEHVADIVFAEGEPGHWPMLYDESHTDDLVVLLQKLSELVTQTAERSASQVVTQPPYVHHSDLIQDYPCNWRRAPGSIVWDAEVPLVDATTLSLRCFGRTWGKLRLQPVDRVRAEVLACTGVFAEVMLPSELTVRAAAGGTLPATSPGLHVVAVRDGVHVILIVGNRE